MQLLLNHIVIPLSLAFTDLEPSTFVCIHKFILAYLNIYFQCTVKRKISLKVWGNYAIAHAHKVVESRSPSSKHKYCFDSLKMNRLQSSRSLILVKCQGFEFDNTLK